MVSSLLSQFCKMPQMMEIDFERFYSYKWDRLETRTDTHTQTDTVYACILFRYCLLIKT